MKPSTLFGADCPIWKLGVLGDGGEFQGLMNPELRASEKFVFVGELQWVQLLLMFAPEVPFWYYLSLLQASEIRTPSSGVFVILFRHLEENC